MGHEQPCRQVMIGGAANLTGRGGARIIY